MNQKRPEINSTALYQTHESPHARHSFDILSSHMKSHDAGRFMQDIIDIRRAVVIACALTGTNRHLNVISSSDGTNFRDKVTLAEETATDSPALAVFGGKLYLAWAQSLGGDLNVLTSLDGVNFESKLTLPERSYWFLWKPLTGEVRRTGPALATFDGKLYIAWASTDKRLNLIPSQDGRDFPNNQKITLEEGSERTPANAEFNGNLYLAWRGNDSHLNVLRLTDLQ
jgi:hypothetical protein